MKHYEKIDGLRCIAIALVLIDHFGGVIPKIFHAGGYYGVDLFFVISGFLITSILFNSRENFWASYKNFIGRRTLRIFPLYYLTIFILFALNVESVRTNLVYFLTYTFNYVWAHHRVFGPVGHFWSLCVEEQFYLFWPFLVLSLNKRYKVLLWVIVAIVVFSFMQKLFGIIPGIEKYNYVNILTRMGSLGFGGLAAILFNTNNIPDKLLRNVWVEYATLIILAVALLTEFWGYEIALAYCSVFLVLKCVHSDFSIEPINRFLRNKAVVFIGTISYGIYIFHLPIAYFFEEYIFNPIWTNIDFSGLGYFERIRWWSWLIKLPICSGLSILMAYFSYRYFERPILRLKDRYFKTD